MSPDILAI